jgi:hypothetical protein
LLRHPHGDSNVTGDVAASVLERSAIATMANAVAYFIALVEYHFVIAVWRAKEAQSDA